MLSRVDGTLVRFIEILTRPMAHPVRSAMLLTKQDGKTYILSQMQIKTIMRYQLILVRMTISKKSTNKKYWRRFGEKETFLHSW